MPKPKSNSKLAKEPIKSLLKEWLVVENISYDEARERLKEQFGIQVKSDGALTNFWQRHCFRERHDDAKELAGELRETLQAAPEAFSEPAIGAICQRVFELSVAKQGDVGELVALAKIMGDSAKVQIKQRELDLAERRVELLEKKAAAFDRVKEAVSESDKLSDAEIRQRTLEAVDSVMLPGKGVGK